MNFYFKFKMKPTIIYAGHYSLSKEELRAFLVKYHSLDTFDRLSSRGGSGGGQLSPSTQIKKLLRRIGSVQYDPLNVVGRNPDLVFQSRIKDYKSVLLEELLYRERSLIDGWDKEMSIYLSADWASFGRVRQARTERGRRTLERRGQEEILSYLPQITEELGKRGPLGARDLKLGACKKNRWGHRQISGAALDYLYTSGELGIHKKTNAYKTYAPIASLIPEKILNAPDPFAGENEFLEWYFLRRIGSIGAYWARNGTGWLGHYLDDSGLRRKTLESLKEKKLIAPFEVPEINETFYVRRKDLSIMNEHIRYDGAVRIMAPLDNMLWDRLLVKKVFDFEYSWEVYVPAEKRKYGYYVLPVLYRNSLIARFEPLKYEKGRPLTIKNWWWESVYDTLGAKTRKGIKEAVTTGLENFAGYLEADGVSLQMRK